MRLLSLDSCPMRLKLLPIKSLTVFTMRAGHLPGAVVHPQSIGSPPDVAPIGNRGVEVAIEIAQTNGPAGRDAQGLPAVGEAAVGSEGMKIAIAVEIAQHHVFAVVGGQDLGQNEAGAAAVGPQRVEIETAPVSHEGVQVAIPI